MLTFCSILAGTWIGNLSLVNVSIPANQIKTFITTGNFTNTTSTYCGLQVMGCDWNAAEYDIAIY